MRTVRISDKKLKLRIKIKSGIPFLNQHQTHESIECPLWHHKVSGPTNACLVIHVVTSWAYKKEVSQCIFVLVFRACDSLVSVCGRGLGPSVQFPGVTHLPAINSSTSTAFKPWSSLCSLSDLCATNLCGFYPGEIYFFLRQWFKKMNK